MRIRRLVLSAALVAISVFTVKTAQCQPLTTPVSVVPDCLIFFDFTAVGNSASFDNRFIGCRSWTVSYTNTGFATLSLIFQDAPDASGVPGAWVTYAGTVVDGINPNTAVTQASTIFDGYFPWLRVRLNATTGGPGRVRGVFYGYRSQPVIFTTLGPGSTVTANQGLPAVQGNRWPVFLSDGVNAQGTQTNPLFSRLSDGTNPIGTTANPLGTGLEYFLGATSTWTPAPACTSRAVVTIAGAGTTEIVPAGAAETIRVCHLSLAMAGATNITVVEGTGVNCATGPANISGAYTNILGLALDFEGRSIVTAAASNAVCVTNSAAVAGGGFVTFSRY